MTKALSVVRKLVVKSDQIIDEVVLDHQERHLKHAHLHSQKGLHLDIDLDHASQLQDGDALKLEDGRLVLVKAKDEHLLELSSDNPLRLLKAAWHLGSTHVSVEITQSALFVPDDPDLAAWARGQGFKVSTIKRGFAPEQGHAHHHHDTPHGSCCGHHH